MNNKKKMLVSIVLGNALWSLSTANAQTAADALPAEILACAAEADVMVRLSCYDREIAALKSRPPAPAVAPTPVSTALPSTPVIRDVPATVVAATVIPATTIPATTSVAASVPAAEVVPTPQASAAPVATVTPSPDPADDFGFDRLPDDVTAEIVKIRKQPYGELIIYLDNGQVWEQKHQDRRFKLRIGETVTVKKSSVAGYRLSGDSNKSIQVIRRK